VFVSVVDLLEDVMQASIPSFIQTVRIKDLSQGDHPVRIISVRTLAEDDALDGGRGEGDDAGDRDGVDGARTRTDQGNDQGNEQRAGVGDSRGKDDLDFFSLFSVDTSDPFVRGRLAGPLTGPCQKNAIKPVKTSNEKPKPNRNSNSNSQSKATSDSDEESEEDDKKRHGRHINLEIAFAYRSLPVTGKKVYSKAKNAHLIIDFGLGLPGVFSRALRECFLRDRASWV
jgi:hypothetical protein